METLLETVASRFHEEPQPMTLERTILLKKLKRDYRRIIFHMAKKQTRSTLVKCDIQTLIKLAEEALLSIADRYKPEKGSLDDFVRFEVRSLMQNYLFKFGYDKSIRRWVRFAARRERETFMIENEGREPTLEELSDRLPRFSVKVLDRYLVDHDVPHDDETLQVDSEFGQAQAGPDEILEQKEHSQQIRARVDAILNSDILRPREKKTLEEYFGINREAVDDREVARRRGEAKKTVKKKRDAILRRLKAALNPKK
ncbi:MAG: hypothetical protein AAB802_04330 [Patescibacteria group bacterium]